MKNNRRIAFATALMLFAMSVNIAAQSPQNDGQKARPRPASGQDKKKPVVSDRLEPDEASRTPSDVSDEVQANRQELPGCLPGGFPRVQFYTSSGTEWKGGL